MQSFFILSTITLVCRESPTALTSASLCKRKVRLHFLSPAPAKHLTEHIDEANMLAHFVPPVCGTCILQWSCLKTSAAAAPSSAHMMAYRPATEWSPVQGLRSVVCISGQDISTWHDIPLYLENGLLSFICEIPKETSAKMEVATVRVYPFAAS